MLTAAHLFEPVQEEMQLIFSHVTRAGVAQSVDNIPAGERQTAYDYGWGAKMLPPLTEALVWRVAQKAGSEGKKALAVRQTGDDGAEETSSHTV